MISKDSLLEAEHDRSMHLKPVLISNSRHDVGQIKEKNKKKVSPTAKLVHKEQIEKREKKINSNTNG